MVTEREEGSGRALTCMVAMTVRPAFAIFAITRMTIAADLDTCDINHMSLLKKLRCAYLLSRPLVGSSRNSRPGFVTYTFTQ